MYLCVFVRFKFVILTINLFLSKHNVSIRVSYTSNFTGDTYMYMYMHVYLSGWLRLHALSTAHKFNAMKQTKNKIKQ